MVFSLFNDIRMFHNLTLSFIILGKPSKLIDVSWRSKINHFIQKFLSQAGKLYSLTQRHEASCEENHQFVLDTYLSQLRHITLSTFNVIYFQQPLEDLYQSLSQLCTSIRTLSYMQTYTAPAIISKSSIKGTNQPALDEKIAH